ncbi:MAG: response regulator [Chloroflexi bacterium]|nr:response regulator [Chloroflexota bacterium]MBU1747072.1 response regulator [Chloroflexota bacterium]
MTEKILIVDDEATLTFFLQQTLLAENQGLYQVDTAASGEEALQCLHDRPYDLLLVDLKMPGIDGLQLIEAVRQIDPQTRVILMTAYGADEVESQAQKLSVFRYMTKPFYIEDLRQAVHDALQGGGTTGQGILILSAESYEKVSSRLHDLRSHIGCQCIFLADVVGQIVAEIGQSTGLDVHTLSTVISGRFAATFEMTKLLGNQNAHNLDFHEGERYEIYSANVGNSLILTIVFDRLVQPSKLGSVWYYTKRAIEDLLSTIHIVESAEAPAAELVSPPPVDKPARPAGKSARPTPPPAAPPPQPAPDKGRPQATGQRQLFNLDQARAMGLIPQDMGLTEDE